MMQIGKFGVPNTMVTAHMIMCALRCAGFKRGEVTPEFREQRFYLVVRRADKEAWLLAGADVDVPVEAFNRGMLRLLDAVPPFKGELFEAMFDDFLRTYDHRTFLRLLVAAGLEVPTNGLLQEMQLARALVGDAVEN